MLSFSTRNGIAEKVGPGFSAMLSFSTRNSIAEKPL
jgi:hypothetical protein